MKGIHDFHRDSSTEYKDWAVETPRDFFGQVLDEWKSLFEGPLPLSEMENFLDAQCPDWAEWAMCQLRKREGLKANHDMQIKGDRRTRSAAYPAPCGGTLSVVARPRIPNPLGRSTKEEK